MSTIEVLVPDIGDFKDVPVIEVFVKPGDVLKPEDPLVSIESDKATMDVPAPAAGTVKAVRIKVGDKVSEGTALLTLDSGDGAAPAAEGASAGAAARQAVNAASAPAPAQVAPTPASRAASTSAASAPAPSTSAPSTARASAPIEVRVPDIGDFKDVPVIEVLVKPGDTVKAEDPLVTLESDKATMDVPSPTAGTVREIAVKVGDKVSEGAVILKLEGAGAAPAAAGSQRGEAATPASKPAPQAPAAPVAATAPGATPVQAAAPPEAAPDPQAFRNAHASPSVRKFARQLGVDLARVKGSGPKGRIVEADVQAFVKSALSAAPGAGTGATAAGGVSGGGTLNLLPWPKVDFAKYGEVEAKPLSRIRKISGANLARNWVMIPHVTQHDEADITELEALRVQLNKEHEKAGVKFTMLAFLIKASVAALKRFPDFNSSLDGDNLVYRKYYNIGFAADTPNGLVVPVLKNADGKGLVAIAQEMAELSARAREGKLGPADMQGGCFSISSLGGIGGTAFTPIVNAPEVAILGVSKGAIKPVWDGKTFQPRLMLPLSLSYDHRVIDGASAARFTAYLATILADLRRVLL